MLSVNQIAICNPNPKAMRIGCIPSADMGFVFNLIHSAVPDLEHIGNIPMTGLRQFGKIALTKADP